jgi:hypothetical protein
VSNFELKQPLSCAIIGLISNHSKAHAARFCFAEAGRFLIPLPWCHNPARLTESRTALWIGTALSEFLLQGPISAFVGAFGVGTKYEDVPFAENLGSGTC